MKLSIPLTGTLVSYDPKLAKYGGSSGITGDLNDPIKPVPIDLGNVSWKIISVDLDNEMTEIEVSPAEFISEDTGQVDGQGEPIYTTRKATGQEKVGFIQHARDMVEGKTKDKLYEISKSPRLKRSFKKK